MVSFRPLGNILLTDLHKKTTYNKDQMAPIICRLFILTATMLFSIVAKNRCPTLLIQQHHQYRDNQQTQ